MTFEEFAVRQMPAVLKFAAVLAGPVASQITAFPASPRGPDTGRVFPPTRYKG